MDVRIRSCRRDKACQRIRHASGRRTCQILTDPVGQIPGSPVVGDGITALVRRHRYRFLFWFPNPFGARMSSPIVTVIAP